MDRENLEKLKAINNPHVEKQVGRFLTLCKPDKVTIITDEQADIDYVRQLSIDNGEEHPLSLA